MRQPIVVLIAKSFTRHIVSGFAHAGAGNCCTPLHKLTEFGDVTVTTVERTVAAIQIPQRAAQDLPVQEHADE
ncbi:MAG TPA: hypothetical protein VMF67_11020 [Rhizomicrobium sp.]|nr:hypothetical protein [Rhizomicrobium sp.]